MVHEEALNLLLANTCPAHPSNTVKGSNVYQLDLCCKDAEVIATPLGDGKYEIHEVSFQ